MIELDFVEAFRSAGLSLLDRGHPRTNQYYDEVMDDIVPQLTEIESQEQLNDLMKSSLANRRQAAYYTSLYGDKKLRPLKEEVYVACDKEPTPDYTRDTGERREFFEVMRELLEFSVGVSEASALGLPEPTLPHTPFLL